MGGQEEKEKEEEEEGAVGWELDASDLLDPNPDILGLFCHYNHIYFDSKLHACTVEWSTSRMTLCAGICKYGTGSCAIRLSEPLLKFRSSVEVKETLLHEMIHAYLWLTNSNQNHDDHGLSFQKMMQVINSSKVLDHQRPMEGYHISIYHNYTDEVNNYRKHHWKCIWCGDIIKRATNRAPSQSDCYQKAGRQGNKCSQESCSWHRHQQHCGGEYKKIAEPEGYKSRKLRACNARVQSKGTIKTENPEVKESCQVPKRTSIEMYFGKSGCIDREKPVTAMEIKEDCQSHGGNSIEDGLIATTVKKRARTREIGDSDGDGTKCEHSDLDGDDFPSISDGKRALALSKEHQVWNRSKRTNVQEDKCTVIIGWRGWSAFEDKEERNTKALKNKRSQRRMFEKASSKVANISDPAINAEIAGEAEAPICFSNNEVAEFGKGKAREKNTQSSVTTGVSDSIGTNVAEVTNAIPKPTLSKNNTKDLQYEMLKPKDIVTQDLTIGAVRDMLPWPNDTCTKASFWKETHVPLFLEQRSVIGSGNCQTIDPCEVEVERGLPAIRSCIDHKMTEERSQSFSDVKDMKMLDDACKIKTLCKGRFKSQSEGLAKSKAAVSKGESAVACPICDVVLVGNIEDASFNTRFNQHIDACMGGAKCPR